MSERKIKASVLLIAYFFSACAGTGGEQEAIKETDHTNETEDINFSTVNHAISGDVINPDQLVYIGAFRLPGDGDRPQTFAYGGNAMTFNPDGDENNSDDFPGSLFIMGHDRIAYGELPDGNQVAEISIPDPIDTRNIENLNTAEFLQGFSNVTEGFFTELNEIPKVGMQYLYDPVTGPKIHLAWGQHLQPQDVPSHAWFEPDLSNSDLQGTWFIGDQNLYSVNGYLFDIPNQWADEYVDGMMLATGRMRDGGQGGMGPTIFAYEPWRPDGSSYKSGAVLDEKTLLLYENAYSSEDIIRAMDGYQHADEWEGGAWLTTPTGSSAVIFTGTKANGDKYWYGYMHPDGAGKVCVDDHVTDYLTCRNADGSPCNQSDLGGCCGEEKETCVSMRGWWSNRFDASIIFYNPSDLAKVANGEMPPWEPQPYAVLDIDEHLYLNPPEWDYIMLGWGDQRRYRIGDVAFDRENGLIYVLELFTDEAKPVVHVWQIG